MNVTVATEATFRRRPDGVVVSPTGVNAYPFWANYLGPFDSVTVLARVSAVTGPPAPERAAEQPVEGPGVRVHPVQAYAGLGGFARHRHRVALDVRAAAAANEGAWLARLPGVVGRLLVAEARRRGQPYAVEVVGDPREAIRVELPPAVSALLAPVAARDLARACREAAAASYVTERHLQARYPAGCEVRAAYSNVCLPEDAFVRVPRPAPAPGQPFQLVTVGTQEARYKGQDVLIDAMTLLWERGAAIRLSIIGEGRLQASLRSRAAASPAAGDIDFLGAVPHAGVRAKLDASDVFVLPSLGSEGLPRALIEAMARGLPCVASAVGGVLELLEPARLVRPGDARALADRLAALLADPAAMASDSRRNLQVARAYEWTRMHGARVRFLADFRRLCDGGRVVSAALDEP